MKMPHRFSLRGPDLLMEELATALSAQAWFEFKPLFAVVHANLRARKAAHGGEEMLRLRLYEKLQTLVQMGGAEKDGKNYRGIPNGLAALTKHFAAEHCQKLLTAVRHAEPAA